MKRRRISLVLTGIAAIAAAGMLAGCGGNEADGRASSNGKISETGSGTGKAADTANTDGTKTGEGTKAAEDANTGDGPALTAMCVGSAADAYRETYQEIADEFSKDNEWGATVNIEFYENEQYKTKLTTLMASNSVPDIFFTWELDYLKPFVEGGKVASLKDAIAEDDPWKNSFADGVLDPVTYDGKLYAVPTQKSFCVMFYNKKIFEENQLSVPTTYEEFLNVCKTLKNNQVTPMILAATDSWIPAQFVQQISNGIAGMELYDGICDGTRKWNDPAHVEASNEVQSMIDEGYFQDGMLGMTAEEVQSQFKQGKAAMYFQGAWDASTILDKNTSTITDCVGAFTLPAKNPQYNNISVGSVDTCFAVAESSPNKEIAVAFLKFWTSRQSEEKLLYEMGRLPSLKLEVDDSKIDPLVGEIISLSNQAKGLTPWWDRAFGAGEGVEFNNQCLAVFGGSDPQKAFDELQSFADENADR